MSPINLSESNYTQYLLRLKLLRDGKVYEVLVNSESEITTYLTFSVSFCIWTHTHTCTKCISQSFLQFGDLV